MAALEFRYNYGHMRKQQHTSPPPHLKALPHYTFDPDRIRIESSYVASTLHPSECALSRSGSDPDKIQSTCRGGFKPDRIRISQFLRRRRQLSRALIERRTYMHLDTYTCRRLSAVGFWLECRRDEGASERMGGSQCLERARYG